MSHPTHLFPWNPACPKPREEVDAIELALWTIRLHGCLQQNRTAWSVTRDRPYLEVHTKAVEGDLSCERVVLFTTGFLTQNASAQHIRELLNSMMVGGGTTGGWSGTGNLVVSGAANPKAFGFQTFNDLLHIGEAAMFAVGLFLIIIEPDGVFQYEVGSLESQHGHSEFASDIIDFSEQNRLRKYYRDKVMDSRGTLQEEGIQEFTEFLDSLFEANNTLAEEGWRYHLYNKRSGPSFSHRAPDLSVFGRIAHDETGNPLVETNYSVIHFVKAITEFNQAVEAAKRNDRRMEVIHGIYTVVALAACTESIANMVHYVLTERFSRKDDSRKPIEALISDSMELAKLARRPYTKLKPKSASYEAIESVRKLRNAFLHSDERGLDVIEDDVLPGILISVTVTQLRKLTKGTREGLRFVVSQVPEVRNIVRLDKQLIWLGELEVP